MVNNCIYIFFSWTPKHYAIEGIGHCIRSSFKGHYHYYDIVTKKEQLKWQTNFKVILFINQIPYK